jgi:outer membrane protein assembly factor BamB
MTGSRWTYTLGLSALTLLAVVLPARSQVLVGTQHNDNFRTGACTRETILTPEAVESGTADGRHFHKLFEVEVDPVSAGGVPNSQIVAQPLFVKGLTMAVDSQRHDVVYVATMHNTVFAIDANDGRLLWVKWFGRPILSHYDTRMDYWGTNPEWGILSTPVIDEANGALYVVTWNDDPQQPGLHNASYQLHALPLASGQEVPGSPVRIEGSFDVPSASGPPKKLKFKPSLHKQRPGLLLSKPSPQSLKGTLFIAFGASVEPSPGNSPETDFHGWVLAYDVGREGATASLKMAPGGAWCATPKGKEGGLWQSGSGLATDREGNLYLATGNGTFRTSPDLDDADRGNTCVKLSYSSGRFHVLDWFTPHNQAQLNTDDADLGSGGPVVIPNTHLLILGGKEGKLYLLDGDNLGRLHDPDRALQAFQVTHAPDFSDSHNHLYWNLHGSPVFWEGPEGPLVYLWGEEDRLKAFQMRSTASGLRFSPTRPVATSRESAPAHPPHEANVYMPGGMLSLSANGAQSGILWALIPLHGNANRQKHVTGVLRAYDASQFVHNTDGTLTVKEIWNSERTLGDRLGNFAKFTPPTIADGKVFVATYSGKLVVYGLKPE